MKTFVFKDLPLVQWKRPPWKLVKLLKEKRESTHVAPPRLKGSTLRSITSYDYIRYEHWRLSIQRCLLRNNGRPHSLPHCGKLATQPRFTCKLPPASTDVDRTWGWPRLGLWPCLLMMTAVKITLPPMRLTMIPAPMNERALTQKWRPNLSIHWSMILLNNSLFFRRQPVHGPWEPWGQDFAKRISFTSECFHSRFVCYWEVLYSLCILLADSWMWSWNLSIVKFEFCTNLSYS